MSDNNYKKLTEKLERECQKIDARTKAIRKKQKEKKDIKKAGGGKTIAKQLYGSEDTDFNYGANEDIDARIEAEQAERCMGSVLCSVCGTFHGYCAEVKEDKEKLKMLPTGDDNQQGSSRRKQGGMAWLKNEDLSLTMKEAKILMVRYNKEGRFGARVEMKLALDGQIRYWGIPPKKDDRNPNYKLLTEKFGHDENDWVEKKILLGLEQDEFSQQYFVRVDFPRDQQTSAKKGSGR